MKQFAQLAFKVTGKTVAMRRHRQVDVGLVSFAPALLLSLHMCQNHAHLSMLLSFGKDIYAGTGSAACTICQHDKSAGYSSDEEDQEPKIPGISSMLLP